MHNTFKRARPGLMSFMAILATGWIATAAVAAEELTVNAFAAYEGEGKIYRTGEIREHSSGRLQGSCSSKAKRGRVVPDASPVRR